MLCYSVSHSLIQASLNYYLLSASVLTAELHALFFALRYLFCLFSFVICIDLLIAIHIIQLTLCNRPVPKMHTWLFQIICPI